MWLNAPRAPTETWNLWHEAHIAPLFQALIETYVARRGVHPNKVYLMGYSAGGDGVRDYLAMRQQRLLAERAYWESPGRQATAAPARPASTVAAGAS